MFRPEIVSAIKAHARRIWPEECCGIVALGDYVPLINQHEDPREHFRIEPAEYLPITLGAPIDAVVHSHVNGKDYPSVADQEGQMRMAMPWGIVLINERHAAEPFWFGDQAPIPPLKERVFRHGVTDCFGLVRDWYRVKLGITLPNLPRSPEWWDNGEDILEENFRMMGFVQIEWQDLEPGDCVMGRIMSKVTNHCGVYLGKNEILHHLPNRPSRIDMLGPWRKHITHFLRYQP